MTRPSLNLNLLTEEVLLLRDAGAVKRSHTCRTIKERNVAEHSHGVAMLIISLYKAAGIRPSGDLLAAALCHDLSEIATGDIPAPVKRYHPGLKEELHKITEAWERHMGLLYDLTKDEANLLLWSDRIEFALFSLEEVKMGNRFFEEYLNRILDWISGMPLPLVDGSLDYALRLYSGVCSAARYELHTRKELK